jgi:methylated-DNA-protein-cysteine methyltransferase-like protein
VVNAKGEIALQDEESRFLQTLYLQEEGVLLNENGLVDLVIYRYNSENGS